MDDGTQTQQTFDPDAFHQQFVQQTGGGFDPDKFHAEYTGADADLKTGAGMIERAQGQARESAARPLTTATLPGQRAFGETPGPLDRFSEITTGTPHPLDSIVGRELPMMASRPGEYLKEAGSQLVKGPAQAAYGLTHHPIDTATGVTGGPQFSEDWEAGRYANLPADVLGGAVNAYGIVKGAQALAPGGPVAEAAASRLNKAGVPSSISMPATPTRARGMYERAVAPGGAAAEEREAIGSEFDRAAPYLADETRGRSISGGGLFDKSEGGAMSAARRTHMAADRVWADHVEPVIDNYSDVQRSTEDIATAIRGSVNETEKALGGNQVNSAEKLANLYGPDKIKTVGEMNDRVTELNNDKAVTRFYNLGPLEQSQALLGDPGLRAKVAELGALRGKMFDTIGESGGEGLGNDFQRARKDWGALRAVEDRLRNARIPAEESFGSRAANTVRSIYRPEYWATRQTLGSLNNPNRLAAGSLNMLGRTDLEPPPAIGRQYPWSPPNRLLKEGAQGLGAVPQEESALGPPAISIAPTTRAQRKGLLLPERTSITTPQQGYSTPVGSEPGGPLESRSGYNAPPIAVRGQGGRMTRGFSSTVGPQQKGTRLGQIAKIGNESWGWNGEKWERIEKESR